MGFLIVVFGLVGGFFGITWLTDKLGWTTLYQKRDASGSGTMGAALLGVEHLFADEHKRAAIVYRKDEQKQVRRQEAGEPPDLEV
ncbi:hypothetical protein J7643_14180 [bacterium]|nr:hypothetical protein [bacterium]